MRFGSPTFLWLLVLVPLLALFFWRAWRKREALLRLFIQSRLLPALLSGYSTARRKFRIILVLAVFVFLALTLARPQWGFTWQEARQRGVDIIVALDASKSMLATDITPNRLARARLAALDLMQTARGDRLGLVAFAGTAFLQCPLTLDDQVFRQNVDSIDVGTMPVGGSALASAIDTAAEALLNDEENFKVLVILTDGEDHDSDAVAAAQKAAESGLRIFTIGIGSPEGTLLQIRQPNGSTDYVRDLEGNVVKSRLNESLLQEIARAGSGFYLPLRGADAIETLYEKGIAPLPKAEFDSRLYKQFHERFQWPLAIAILLLIIETLLPDHKREPRRAATAEPIRSARAGVASMLFALLIGAAMPLHADTRKALEAYEAGNFDEALQEYESILHNQIDPDPRLHYNAGAAAYRAGKYDDALKHYQSALESPDLELQQNAWFNIGNTLYQAGTQSENRESAIANLENAIKSYDSALKLKADDAEARHNQELVKQQLEILKQQPPSEMQGQDSNQNPEEDQSEQGGQSGSKGGEGQQDQQQAQDSESQQQQQQDSQSQQANQSDQQQDDNTQRQQDALAREQQQEQQESAGIPEQNEEQAADQPPQPTDGQGEEEQQTSAGEEPAPGQMTAEQAERLLDRARDDEKTLNFNAQQGRADSNRNIKDW